MGTLVLKTTVSLHDPDMPGWSELANDIVVNEKTLVGSRWAVGLDGKGNRRCMCCQRHVTGCDDDAAIITTVFSGVANWKNIWVSLWSVFLASAS
jgi:hypothetical protein